MNKEGRQLLSPNLPTRLSELVRRSGSLSFAIIRLPAPVRRQMIGHKIVKRNGKAIRASLKKVKWCNISKIQVTCYVTQTEIQNTGNHQNIKEMNS